MGAFGLSVSTERSTELTPRARQSLAEGRHCWENDFTFELWESPVTFH
jgi:hypothetical protein